MNSAGTQGLLSPQGTGVLGPSPFRSLTPARASPSAPSAGLFPPDWPSCWLTDTLSSTSLGAFAPVVPLL